MPQKKILDSELFDSAGLSSGIARVLSSESTIHQEAVKLGVSEEQLEELLHYFSKCAQQITDTKTQENEPDIHPAVISYQLIVNRYCVLIFPAALFDLSDLSDRSDRSDRSDLSDRSDR